MSDVGRSVWRTSKLGPRITLQFERKLADLWVGVYLSPDETWRSGTAWLCVVPCFPLKIDWRV